MVVLINNRYQDWTKLLIWACPWGSLLCQPPKRILELPTPFFLSSFLVNRAKKKKVSLVGREAKPVKIIRAKDKRHFDWGRMRDFGGECVVRPGSSGGSRGRMGCGSLWLGTLYFHPFHMLFRAIKEWNSFFKLNE